MSQSEIVLPETKPETEWVRGRALQKVSPTYSHARLQSLLAAALTSWNDARPAGRVGTEWRFRVTPHGGRTRPLVPDVAYIAYAELRADAPPADVEVPLASPTVAIEILSPDDRPRDVDDKIATYLAAGTSLVVVVDPKDRTFGLHDDSGIAVLTEYDTFRHDALPSLAIDLSDLFTRASR